MTFVIHGQGITKKVKTIGQTKIIELDQNTTEYVRVYNLHKLKNINDNDTKENTEENELYHN